MRTWIWGPVQDVSIMYATTAGKVQSTDNLMCPYRIGRGTLWKTMTSFAYVVFKFWCRLVRMQPLKVALQVLQDLRQTQVFPDHLHQDLQGANRAHLPGDEHVLHLLIRIQKRGHVLDLDALGIALIRNVSFHAIASLVVATFSGMMMRALLSGRRSFTIISTWSSLACVRSVVGRVRAQVSL